MTDVRDVVLALQGKLRPFAAVVSPVDVDPDDLLQEAWVRVLRAHPLDNYVDIAAYMRRTIVNLANNERRRLRRGQRALAALRSSAEAAQHDAMPSDLADLQRLDPVDRAVLYLLEIEGWTHREVGTALGFSEGASRVRFSRARHRLRLALEETT